MSLKSRFATVLGVPAGGVWLFDTFIANMPIVVEGGLFAAGVGAAWLGGEGVRKLVHAATTSSDAPAPTTAAPVAQEQAPAAPAPTVEALPPAQRERVQEALQAAFLMGADSATARKEVTR